MRSLFRFFSLLLLANNLHAAEILTGQNNLARLAAAVAGSGYAQQQGFAATALDELIDDYQSVLDNAYEQVGKTPKEQRKLYRWRSGTQSFVDQLLNARDHLEIGGSLSIEATATGQVILYIAAKPTVIEGPNVAASGPLAKRIIASYCTAFDCSQLFKSSNLPKIQNADFERDLRNGSGYWSFRWNRGPRYETDDGLIFEFSKTHDRLRKQQTSEALVMELRQLASALRGALQGQYLIDWAYLEIRQTEGGLGNKVMLNASGDFLRLKLPVLSRITLLPAGIFTWLHARVRGNKITVELLHAEEWLMIQNDVEG